MTTQQEALQAAQLFGVNGTLCRLAGEYDYNYRVKSNDGVQYILKIAAPDTALATLCLQNAALHWLKKQNVPFAIPVPQLCSAGTDIVLLANTYPTRLFAYVPGELLGNLPTHSDSLLKSLGTQLGYLSKALANFKPGNAKRALAWDFNQATWTREKLTFLSEEEQEIVAPFLQHFETLIAPQLPLLRQSIIHGDLNDYNILTTDDEVTGFIDFGDIIETATIAELAIALTYAMLHKSDPITAACHIIKAYHAQFPLRKKELAVLYYLIAMRLCMSVINSAERKRQQPSDPYLTISEAPAWQLLRQWQALAADEVFARFYQACDDFKEKSVSTDDLIKVRKRIIGKNVGLSYDEPLQIVRGEGQYLFDERGKRYLDCVNNVCHVGHCHPEVVRAGHEQMALLNTNTRYLNAALTDYASALLATFPKPLSVCFFVCSGSEANELALRLAKTYTQQQRIAVLNHAYHGNTDKLVQISPYKFNGKGGKGPADFLEVLPLPAEQIEPILSAPVGAFIAESLPSCAGQIVLPPNYLAAIYAQVRRQGGVCIADEVQVGLGRIGSHFWGFASQDVIPDIVTLGKPLGNGHPVGAVITTQAIADAFCNGMEYFNTFGGNPVSCRIGLSVLHVIEKEGLQQHADNVGRYFKEQLTLLAQSSAAIADVRGLGLFLGIELRNDHHTAKAVVNQLKTRGVLLSTDGPNDNVIKIKPPMVFNRENVDEVIDKLAQCLN